MQPSKSEADYELIRKGECPKCHAVGTLQEISLGHGGMIACTRCNQEWDLVTLMHGANPTKTQS